MKTNQRYNQENDNRPNIATINRTKQPVDYSQLPNNKQNMWLSMATKEIGEKEALSRDNAVSMQTHPSPRTHGPVLSKQISGTTLNESVLASSIKNFKHIYTHQSVKS